MLSEKLTTAETEHTHRYIIMMEREQHHVQQSGIICPLLFGVWCAELGLQKTIKGQVLKFMRGAISGDSCEWRSTIRKGMKGGKGP